MIIVLLLRRMSPRARHITGWILLGLGAVVAAASLLVHDNLYFHGAILATCGIIFLKANPKPRARKQTAAGEAGTCAAGTGAHRGVSGAA